jgi:hypothetical protein
VHKLLRNLIVLQIVSAVSVISAFGQSPKLTENLPAPREISSPAAANSAEPNLYSDNQGKVYLSWIEKIGEGKHSLKFSMLEKGKWSDPRQIAEGDNWFVNWADFPSLIAAQDGSLMAHWLAKSGADTYAYDVNISRSTDRGKTWSKPVKPHRDQTKTEHGFVSLIPLSGGHVAAVWLDGRQFTSKDHGDGGHGASSNEMTLRYTTIGRDGRMSEDEMIDSRVCECCQTSAAMTSEGAVVVYRDRSEKEIRDISIVRLAKGRWSEPRTIHSDGWEINGCPVNGPSVAADRRKVAVAWFTGAKDTARVKVVFSNDAGASFGQPFQVDDGDPIGRVSVLILKDGSALVVWMERVEKSAQVKARIIRPDGSRASSITVARSSSARASGFPRMARAGNDIVFAWTEPGNTARVRTAMINITGYK